MHKSFPRIKDLAKRTGSTALSLENATPFTFSYAFLFHPPKKIVLYIIQPKKFLSIGWYWVLLQRGWRGRHKPSAKQVIYSTAIGAGIIIGGILARVILAKSLPWVEWHEIQPFVLLLGYTAVGLLSIHLGIEVKRRCHHPDCRLITKPKAIRNNPTSV